MHAVAFPVPAGVRLDHENGNTRKYQRITMDKLLHADRPRLR